MTVLVQLASWSLVVSAALVVIHAAARAAEPRFHRPRPSAIALWLLVAVPSLAQFAYPALLDAFRRDWNAITAGQLWRLVTSALVQDGGIPGTVFNLFALGIVVLAAQQYWRPSRIWVTFWAGAIGSNLIVGPFIDPLGAGNSMATFTLGCAVAMNALLSRPATHHVIVPGIGFGVSLVVIAVGLDYHVISCLLGLILGMIPPHRQVVSDRDT